MKYREHYKRLMSRAKERVLVGYSERHHVRPKCMGGTNDKRNFVRLTAEEHLVAHELLVKIFPEKKSLAIAAARMSRKIDGNKAYGWLRRKHAQAMKGNQYLKGHKHSAETRLKMSQKSAWFRGPHSPEWCRAISEGKKGKTHRGVPLSEETKRKISIARTGQKCSAETRKKISVAYATKLGLTGVF